MKTKDEIAENIWKQAKKSFAFQVASGIILPLVLFFFPTTVHINFTVIEMLGCCAGLSVMFIVYGILELSTHRKTIMRKTFDSMVDKKNNTEFMYESVSGKTTRGESILVSMRTKSYNEFHEAMNAAFGCNIFGPVIFFVAGIGGLSFGDNTLWLHANPYLAIILFSTYLYLMSRIDKGYYKIWKEEFTFACCEVNLKESLPYIFEEYSIEDAMMPLYFILPPNENEEAFAKQITTNCIADVKEQHEEDAKETTKNTIVA